MGHNSRSEQDQEVFSELSAAHRESLDERNLAAANVIADEMAEESADDPEFDDTANREMIINHLQNHPDAIYPYLVRGAVLYCHVGTHIRKLNLPICHGIYTGEDMHPVIHAEDAEPEKNVMYFGHCHGTIGESGDAEQIDLKTVTYTDLVLSYTGDVARGYKCKPQIIDNQWQMTYRDTRIVRNNQYMSEANAVESVTGASFLVCRFGGLIEPLTSGQEPTE